MARSGAQLLLAGLEAAGVDVVFGLPGVHNLAAWEALRESPIRLVGVRHEQAAGYAADGYAPRSGRRSPPPTATRARAGASAWRSSPPARGRRTRSARAARRGRAARRCSSS